MQNTAYKQNRAYTTVHKKLMAAIAMLLIASILLATTTYAWYVLSTAPEVTGITTTVGSNGALEIALVNDQYTTADKVPSGTGDSIAATKDATVSNITWGNLVDLSDEDYGFGEMTLNLATSSGASGLAALLSYPLYGADGRVSELVSGMDVASYDPTAKAFQITTAQSSSTGTLPSYMGVRALGTTSSTNVYESALKTQQAAVKSAVSTAKNNVPNTLETNMMSFMLFGYAYMNGSSTTASSTYMTLVDTLITAMENTNSKIEAAMKAAILAYVASDTDLYDSYYATLKDYDFDTLYTAANAAGVIPDDVASVYTTYESLVETTNEARTSYDALVQGTATLGDLVEALRGLVDVDGLVCSVDGEVVNLKEAASSAIDGEADSVTVYINENGGAFYELAALIGNYTAEYSNSGVSVGITTGYTEDAALDTLQTYVTGLTVTTVDDSEDEDGEDEETTALTDIYGYVLDFWFRTNATSAYLLLQTEAATRIAGEDDTSVQGAGSYVQFAEGTNETLAKAVKLIFIDSSENVLATASITDIDEDYKGWLALDNGYKNITTLTQNVGQQISVVVYIDGTAVDNTMVSADSTVSFTLNLQFSTNTTLTPMTYSSDYATWSSSSDDSSDTDTGSGTGTGDTDSGDDSGDTGDTDSSGN